RWLRRGTEPGPAEPPRGQRARADGVVLPHPRLAEDVRRRRGETGVDNEIAELGFAGVGAWILGRNMFGPVRGPWPDDRWRGWWGEEPPYHAPVFVLTHHPREPLRMGGSTEFHFVTAGIHAALEQARASAGGRDVRLGGGVATVR